MSRTVIIWVLLVVIIGTLGTASFLVYQRGLNEKGWNQVHMAEAMLGSSDYEGAIKTLLPIIQKGKKFEGADMALYHLAMAYEGAKVPDATAVWERLVTEFPQSPYFPEAQLKQAWSVVDSDPEKSQSVFSAIVDTASEALKIEAQYGLAFLMEKRGKAEDARAYYYRILEGTPEWEIESKVKDRLTEMNNQTLWSPVVDEFSDLYTVEPKDAPVTVGQKFKTTAWYILEANGLQSMLHPGRRLKVPKEPFWVRVNKTRCRLELLTESGRFIKWYPCGVGKQSYKTPAGEYTIQNKEPKPVWYKPGGGVIPYGDPDNALGERWMGIGGSLGIHGTNEPETIGKPESAGCIRMLNEDAIELYKLITYGTRVTIIEGD